MRKRLIFTLSLALFFAVIISAGAPLPAAGEDPLPLKLIKGRSGSAAVLEGGSIYILGGASANAVLGDIEKLDLKTGKTAFVTDKLHPRKYHTAQAYKGKIYIMGGHGHSDVVEIYDIAADTVTFGAPMPQPRYMPASVLIDGKIYIIGGGYLKKFKPPSEEEASDKVDVYDIEKDTWIEKASMPTARQTTAALLNGKIYAIGGYNNETALSDFDIYSIKADTWAKQPALPFALSANEAVVIGDKIFSFGDYAEPGRVCFYDPAAGTWKILKTDYRPSYNNSVIAAGESVYIIGGNASPEDFNIDLIQVIPQKKLLELSK